MDATNAPAISVIIPARNAVRILDACLAAVLRHVPAPRREIIVVDHGSTDGTSDLARQQPVRVVRQEGGFVSHARNAGARVARHEILAFVDSDCTVQAGWYEALVNALADLSVGVTGCRHELPAELTWCERVWGAAHRPPLPDSPHEVSYIPAGNLVIRKAIFDSLGGFDESLETGEDPDLCARVSRAGFRIVQDPRIRCVHHGEPKTLFQVFRRERWHGRGARFRYGDGRLAPVTVSTFGFAALLIAGLVGVAAALLTPARWPLLLLLAPGAVPAAYAVRKRRTLSRKRQLAQLWLVYWAYFLGRASALPTVTRRLWGA